jgi:hypothetical protein
MTKGQPDLIQYGSVSDEAFVRTQATALALSTRARCTTTTSWWSRHVVDFAADCPPTWGLQVSRVLEVVANASTPSRLL